MKKSIIVLLLLVTSFITNAQDTDLAWLNGTWTGVGYQAPTDTNWEVQLTYNNDTKKFTVNYPTLECSGKWVLKTSEVNKANLTEYITEGKNNCDNMVQVVVTHINEEYISVAYFVPLLHDGVVAYAVLRRMVV